MAAFKPLDKYGESRISNDSTLHDTPSGDAQSLAFTLAGYDFMAISAGPYFTANPSISFIVNFDPSHDDQAEAHLDAMWATLSDGGNVLMPLDAYPFSKHYGWVQDKFGISWQLMLTNPEGEPRPLIIPSLLFTQERCGQAEAAGDFYLSVFHDAKRGTIARYAEGMEPEKPGTVMFSEFQLEGQWFTAMDSAQQHEFTFNEGISLVIRCKDQTEIDYYWDKLSAIPEAEQCGWLKDKFGISWQVVPSAMDEMMSKGAPEQIARVTKAFLQMKKFDIAALEAAYRGE